MSYVKIDCIRRLWRVASRFFCVSVPHPPEVRAKTVNLNGGISMLKKALVCAVSISALLVVGAAHADTKGKKIALSNNYAGNSWRQAMLKSWDKVTKKAVADGVVAAADAFTTSENQVTEQAAQIQNLILQGYNAIVINAASPDALNGVVKQACDAGITVVSFDGIVTEPCAWRVAVDFKKMGRLEVEYLAKKMPAGGNLLEIRGLAGVFVDDEIHAGIADGVKANPQFKIVGSVHGNWAQEVAQKEVAGILPSLPEIKAVVTQGGDGYGAAQAFAAAGRPTPTIIMGNRQDELQWWKEQKDKNGYETMSASIAPGVSTLAFWVAQMILDGKQVPKDLTVPFLTIEQANIDAAAANTEKGGVANVEYSAADAAKVVAGK